MTTIINQAHNQRRTVPVFTAPVAAEQAPMVISLKIKSNDEDE